MAEEKEENGVKAEAGVAENKKETGDVDALLAAGDEKTPAPSENKDEKGLDTLQAEANTSDLAAAAEAELKAKEESQSEMNKNIYVPLAKPSYEGDGCEKAVEERRAKFQSGMKAARKISSISMIVMVVLLIAGFVSYNYLAKTMAWLVYVIFGILVVVMITAMVLSSRTRKKLYGDADVYVHDVIADIDSYVFDNPTIKEAVVAKSGHIDLSMLIQAHYFDTINAVNSRNIVRASYYGKEITVSEIAARVPYQVPEDDKDHSADDPKKLPKDSYGVFGKYVTCPVTLSSGAAIIILMKGTNAYKPTFVDGYAEKAVEGLDSRFLVWANSDQAVADFFTKDNLSLVNGFQSDANMENMFISVNDFGTKAALNYNESVMEVPMEKPVQGTPYVHYKEDIGRVLGIIKNLISSESDK